MGSVCEREIGEVIASAFSNGSLIQYDRHTDQIRQTSRFQFLDNVGAVQLDGTKADAKARRDNFVRLASGDQFEYLAFAGC